MKRFLKEELGFYDKDILEILEDMNISDPSTDFCEFTQSQWKELRRRAVVERLKELKDQSAKDRMEGKLKKLEEHWREQSGITRTGKKKNLKQHNEQVDDEKSYHTKKSKKRNQMLLNSDDLKLFLQRNGCFSIQLLTLLSEHGISSIYALCAFPVYFAMIRPQSGIHKESDIPNIKNSEMNQIQTKFRVSHLAKTEHVASTQRSQKMLADFRKIWKKRSQK